MLRHPSSYSWLHQPLIITEHLVSPIPRHFSSTSQRQSLVPPIPYCWPDFAATILLLKHQVYIEPQQSLSLGVPTHIDPLLQFSSIVLCLKMRFSTSSATLAFIAAFASATPSNAVRRVAGNIYPCTDSTFPVGSSCPSGISRGSGFCAALSVEPGVCCMLIFGAALTR